jgi:hypothetical protein
LEDSEVDPDDFQADPETVEPDPENFEAIRIVSRAIGTTSSGRRTKRKAFQ